MGLSYGKTFLSQGITSGVATPGTANSSSPVLLIPPDLTPIYTGDDKVLTKGFQSALVQGIIGSNRNVFLPMTVQLQALVSITNGKFSTSDTAQVINNAATNTEIQNRKTIQQNLAALAQPSQNNQQNNSLRRKSHVLHNASAPTTGTASTTQSQITSNYATYSGLGIGTNQRFIMQNTSDLSINANDLALKINAMNKLPSLVFLVNPETFSRSLTKKTEEFFTRSGWSQEFWGEELDTFTLDGQIGGTYTDKFGLTRFFRRDSSSYQNLMQLYLYYKNNGRIFEDLDPRRIAIVGNVIITYDLVVYIGVFESFEITETADAPFNLKYNMTFTVRQTLLPNS